ncbi:rhomboid family intramembrane serine protease, partial [bacterium]|nr:rhomboid family intramembrane serine protease [bacterium]
DMMMRDLRQAPIVTGVIIGVCAYLYGSLLKEGVVSPAVLARYCVYLDPAQVWDGRYWTLLTSAFVHEHLVHMIFNLVCLGALAGLLEQSFGHQATFAVVFFGAIVSLGVEFALSGATGTGMSGVVFAMFGWLWATHKQVPELRRFLSPERAPLLSCVMMVAIFTGWLGLWPTGNAAHCAGLMFGMAVGYGFYHKQPILRWAASGALVALTVIVVLGLTFAVWNSDWTAWHSHQHQKLARVELVR